MEYNFVPMQIKEAAKINKWEYKGYVKEIYMDPYFESHKKGDTILKGPNGCYGFAVYKENELFGLFEYYMSKRVMEIGLALNPKFVGKGLALEYLTKGLKFGIEHFNYQEKYIKLYVNKENKPALKVYKKAGFKIITEEDDEYEMQIETKNISKRSLNNE